MISFKKFTRSDSRSGAFTSRVLIEMERGLDGTKRDETARAEVLKASLRVFAEITKPISAVWGRISTFITFILANGLEKYFRPGVVKYLWRKEEQSG